MKSTDIKVGDVFTRWTVVDEVERVWTSPTHSFYRVLCKCICGTEKYVAASALFAKKPSKSCGCIRRELAFSSRKEIPVGSVHGRLTVEKEIETRKIGKKSKRMVSCSCSCGSTNVELQWELVSSGATSSCGCYHRERKLEASVTHGMTKTREYASWSAARTRCYNSNDKYYPDYGGRGITMSEDWLRFEKFYTDMGVRPEGASLERKDVNGNYCKENCVWANCTQQAFNRRKRKNTASKYVGLSFSGGKWRVVISKNNIRKHVGSFSDEIEAARAYDRACIEWYGVTKNFPLEDYLKEK